MCSTPQAPGVVVVTAPCRLLPGLSAALARRRPSGCCLPMSPSGLLIPMPVALALPRPALPRQTFPERGVLCPWPLGGERKRGVQTPPTSLTRTRPPSPGSGSPVILARPAAASPRGGEAEQPLRPAGASATPWRLRWSLGYLRLSAGASFPFRQPPLAAAAVSGEGAQLVREVHRPPTGTAQSGFCSI